MSPTEQQRRLGERPERKPRRGLDVWAHGLVGRCKRGPWTRHRLATVAQSIDRRRAELEKLADPQLNERLIALRQARQRQPERWQPLLEEGLALLAVAAHRELGLRAYEVQLMGAAALVEGYFTEVDTGEGKTLAIGLAAAYLAWSGLPCHVITANDYLAGRDAKHLGRYYLRVGLTAGAVMTEDDESARHSGYAAGVTYTTAKELAADYLRDRLRLGDDATGASSRQLLGVLLEMPPLPGVVQRGLHSALIDEADHALIDEAVTPLIISRTLDAGELSVASQAAWELVRDLNKGVHYRADSAARLIEMLPAGIEQTNLALALPRTGLWASDRRRQELVRLGLEAREFFLRDEHYVIDDGKVVIVDAATGRPMPLRTWRQGLHQIIEAKEGLEVSGPSETLARISFQAFFRKYSRLAGASGTLREAAAEIWHTYDAPFVAIPRHLPCQRRHQGSRFFVDEDLRDQALVHELKTRHARGQPLLIGTRTVDSSEAVARLVRHHGLPGSQVLNALRHREEAVMVAHAGHRGQITIATSMAGRGTDIRLEEGVATLGGLQVVAIEANDSARVDRQLFGRSARQGDPGGVIAFYSTEDAVLRRFIPHPILQAWQRSTRLLPDALNNAVGRRLLAWAQRRAQWQAARQRRGVMLGEEEIRRSLGFTVGRGAVTTTALLPR